jgi:hypothetical protein
LNEGTITNLTMEDVGRNLNVFVKAIEDIIMMMLEGRG